MEDRSECPVCRSGRRLCLTTRLELNLLRCRRCGHTYASRSQLDAEQIELIYEGDYCGLWRDEQFRSRSDAEMRRGLLPRVPPPAHLLDVGCGNGEFLHVAVAGGYMATGIDISRSAIDLCRARGLKAELARIEHHRPEAPYDVVTLWDVVEHLPDPLAVLRDARRLLREGGWILVKTPFVTEPAFALVKRLPGLQRAVLHLPGHIQFFTPASLALALEVAGFGAVDVSVVGAMRGRRPTRDVRRRLGQLRTAIVTRATGSRNLLAYARC